MLHIERNVAHSREFNDVVSSRKSTRAFTQQIIDQELVKKILITASQSPSWCNIQPWSVYYVCGDVLDKMKNDLVAAAKVRDFAPEIEFVSEYPKDLLLRKQENDKKIMKARELKDNDFRGIVNAVFDNWRCFGAPQVLFITVNKRTIPYGLVDVGCFLQTLLLAMTAEGLSACTQASLVQSPHIVRKYINITEYESLVCGVSFGVEDSEAEVNSVQTDRIELSNWFNYNDMVG